jgi:hypothetical protein
MSAFYTDVSETIGSTLTLLWISGYTFAASTNDSILLFFHLSYYSIAFYIKLLTTKLTSDKNSSGPYWKGVKKTLLNLHGASKALGSVFSIPVLYIITAKFVMVSFSLFSIIYALVNPNKAIFSLSWIINHLLSIFKNVASVLIILHAADLPALEV